MGLLLPASHEAIPVTGTVFGLLGALLIFAGCGGGADEPGSRSGSSGRVQGVQVDRALPDLAERFVGLGAPESWRLADSVSLQFGTYHPQGMARAEGHLFLSSVQIEVPTRPVEADTGAYDRTAGEGTGHLFVVGDDGAQSGHLRLGEGEIYHPGGIDSGMGAIWVPVAQYRPHSRSIVYRVDPATLEAEEVFRFDDHLGALIVEESSPTLVAANWDARRFYAWSLTEEGGLQGGSEDPIRTWKNPAAYVAYQDCQSVGAHLALCSGQRGYRPSGPGASSPASEFTMGGIDLIDLRSGAPVWQRPSALRAPPGVPMTRNPFLVEPGDEGGLRFLFAPADDSTVLYVYEAVEAAPNGG